MSNFLNYLIWIIDWSFNQYGSKFVSINNNLKDKKSLLKRFSYSINSYHIPMFIALFNGIIWYKYRAYFLYFNLSLVGNFQACGF